jgi:large subunit ribosomal protein L10e
MAKLRKFAAYRGLNRPYTRKSKYRAKSFVRSNPHNRISRYNMGNLNAEFTHVLDLVVDATLQIRDNALESARLVTLRRLEKNIGKIAFYFKIRVHPHHILRENPLASGAGADRMSTGMKCSFGKAIGVAAQLKKGQTLFRVTCNEEHVAFAKEALALAGTKLPCHCRVIIR